MSVSSVIKSLANGKNNVFAKVNANKGAYFKKLSNVMLNNNPIPTFNNTPKGVPNQTVNAIAAKNNLADQYSENTHANTSLRTDELKLNKPNAFVNTTRQKIIKNENSYIPPTTGVGIAPRINYTKTNVTSSVAENYKHKSTESIPSKLIPNDVKTLTGSGFIGTKETLSRIANNITNNSSVNNITKNDNSNSSALTKTSTLNNNITKNDNSNSNSSTLTKTSTLNNNITKNDNSNSSTLDAFNRISQVTQNLDNNRPKGSAPTVAKDNTPDLSSISTPINELVSETKEYSGKFKLLNDEQKKQTKLLEKISISLDKGGSGGLIEAAADMFDKKRGKGLGRRVASKLGNIAKRAVPFIKNNLGGISKVARTALGSAGQIARTAATSGLATNTTMAAGRLLARATPVGMAIATGATIGDTIGSAIYKKYENTDFMKGVGEKVAKVAAFFGNDEAKQAVSDTATYESNAALSEKAKANKANVQREMTAQGMSKTAQAAVLGNLEVESGFQTKSENTNYSNSSNERIREIFKTKTKGMSDAELTALKKDPVAFADKMYAELGGHKFRGRGLVQLTGKDNYAKYSQQIFGDDRLVKNPDLANDPEIAAKVAVAYTKERAGKVAKKRFGKDLNDLSYDEASNAVTQSVAGEGNDLSKGIHAKFAAKKHAAGRKYLNEPSTDTEVAAIDKSKTEAKINKQTPTKPGEGTVLAKKDDRQTPTKPGEGTVLAKKDNTKNTKDAKPTTKTSKLPTSYAKTAKNVPIVAKAASNSENIGNLNQSKNDQVSTVMPSTESNETTPNKELSTDSENSLMTKIPSSESNVTASNKELSPDLVNSLIPKTPSAESNVTASNKELSPDLVNSLMPKNPSTESNETVPNKVNQVKDKLVNSLMSKMPSTESIVTKLNKELSPDLVNSLIPKTPSAESNVTASNKELSPDLVNSLMPKNPSAESNETVSNKVNQVKDKLVNSLMSKMPSTESIVTASNKVLSTDLVNSLMPKNPSAESNVTASNKELSPDLIAALVPKPQATSTSNIKASNSVESLATAYASSRSMSSTDSGTGRDTMPPPQVASGQLPPPTVSGGPTASGNVARGGSNKNPSSSSGDAANKENAMMAVRNISSTIQRVFDKDFQLGV